MDNKLRRYHPNFVADLRHAINYYKHISPSVANNLRDEIKAKIGIIMSCPEGFAVAYKDVRALRLQKFPYVVLYRSYADHVQFVGLVHGSIERKQWFDSSE